MKNTHIEIRRPASESKHSWIRKNPSSCQEKQYYCNHSTQN